MNVFLIVPQTSGAQKLAPDKADFQISGVNRTGTGIAGHLGTFPVLSFSDNSSL